MALSSAWISHSVLQCFCPGQPAGPPLSNAAGGIDDRDALELFGLYRGFPAYAPTTSITLSPAGARSGASGPTVTHGSINLTLAARTAAAATTGPASEVASVVTKAVAGAWAYATEAYCDAPVLSLDPDPFVALLDAAVAPYCWAVEIDALSLAARADVAPGYATAAMAALPYSGGLDAVADGVGTWIFTNRGFTSRSDDTPASVHMPPRLASLVFERRLAGRASLGGLPRLAGDLSLHNLDSGFDAWLADYSLSGRRVALRLGRASDAYDDFGRAFTGITTAIDSTRQSLRLALSDGLARLDRPVQINTYSGAGGLGGGADIAGHYRPRAYGQVYNVPAVLVDSSRLIYQVHDGQMFHLDAVYDRGVALTYSGTDYASGTELLAAAPAAGQYQPWTGGGYFRLGAAPAGTITADLRGDATGGWYVSTTADIVRRLLTASASLYDNEIDAVAMAQVNGQAPATVGIWVGTEAETIAAVVESLVSAIGGWAGFGRMGAFMLGVIGEPAGGPAALLDTSNILDIERLTLPGDISPRVWRVKVGYQHNYTVTSDLAATVTAARRDFSALADRVAVSEDTSVATRYLGATALEVLPGHFAAQEDAAAEALRLFNFFSLPRALYRVVTTLSTLRLDLGSLVQVTHPRLGLASGKLARVVGHRVDTSRAQVELTVLT